jgi:hypothetical protein
MSINSFLDKKIKKSINSETNLIIKEKQASSDNDLLDNQLINLEDDIEIEKLEKEFEHIEKKIVYKNHPKNYGNLWTDEQRHTILKLMKKNDYTNQNNLYDEEVISKIAVKLERTDYGVKEEIRKMLYNDYIGGLGYNSLSLKYNIPESYIKLLIKIHLEKNGKKILESIQIENNILKSMIENIKLKKELDELNK